MKDFENALIIDPNDYNPNNYEIGQKVRYKDGDELLNAIISDVDYISGAVVVNFVDEDMNDMNIEK